MSTLPKHLKQALTYMNHAKHQLECAREHADTPRYQHQWGEAINKALRDNEEAWLHIGNILHLVRIPILVYEPPSAEKEN